MSPGWERPIELGGASPATAWRKVKQHECLGR